jgi:3-oxoacyl-[acyl-carrier-protein] synthase III
MSLQTCPVGAGGGWPLRVTALGHYLPERVVTSAELEVALNLKPGWIERVTGVRERRYAGRHETSTGMAARAARVALERAGLTVGDVDLIIGASAALAQMIPCGAALLARELGGSEGQAFCMDVNATCLSFLTALHVAAPLLATGAYRRALIFSSENRVHSLNPDEPESAALMGDAAVAAVVERAPDGDPARLCHARFATHTVGADYTRILGGGTLHHPNDPETAREMNYFHMNGPAVYRLAAKVFPPFLDRFFEEVGWDREAVTVVPHQASGHAVTHLAARVGFRPEQVITNLATRGNCVAASVPLALSEAVESGRIRRGDRVLLTGTGAGLTLGAVALTF